MNQNFLPQFVCSFFLSLQLLIYLLDLESFILNVIFICSWSDHDICRQKNLHLSLLLLHLLDFLSVLLNLDLLQINLRLSFVAKLLQFSINSVFDIFFNLSWNTLLKTESVSWLHLHGSLRCCNAWAYFLKSCKLILRFTCLDFKAFTFKDLGVLKSNSCRFVVNLQLTLFESWFRWFALSSAPGNATLKIIRISIFDQSKLCFNFDWL